MANRMLTTTDNPFNPFTQFDQWYAYDTIVTRHNCCSLIAAQVGTSIDLSDEEEEKAIDNAIDQIILNDPLNIFTVAISNEKT